MTTDAAVDGAVESVRPLSVGGLDFAYRALRQPRARTEPVLVVGGALQGMYGWPWLEARLAPVASVVTADLPGMGGASPLPPGPVGELLTGALAAIVDDLGATRVNLFGYSYGAQLVFDLARARPERVARLLLGGVPVRIDAAQREAWRRGAELLAAGRHRDFAEAASAAMLCLDEQRPVRHRQLARRYVCRSLLHAVRNSPHATDALRRALDVRPGFADGLTPPVPPTLVFSGAHDTVCPAATQREFAATIPGARFELVEEADHWAVLERPDEVAELAVTFLTS